MNTRTLTACLVLAATSSLACATDFRSCTQPANGIIPRGLPWLPNRANQNACDQVMISSAQQITNSADKSDNVAAFRDGKLVGFRDRNPDATKPQLFNSNTWRESGSVGQPGELWWGRSDDREVLVGQESYVRLGMAAKMPSRAEMMQRLAEFKRRMEAAKRGQPLPPPTPVPDNSGLFPHRAMKYRQIGSTSTTFKGGLGGEGDIPLGEISHAELTLETSPMLRGTLQFDLNIDGTTRKFSFPVMANVSRKDNRTYPDPEQKYRLRGAALVDGEYYRCGERPDVSKPYALQECEVPGAPSPNRFVENYEAYGAFFGEHATFAAIHFLLIVNSRPRNRTGAHATGIIILKSTPDSSNGPLPG